MKLENQKIYSFDNQTIADDVRRIKRLIWTSMNGDVVRSMAAKGVRYSRNLGVPLTRLNEIAADCEANKLVAEQLWQSKSREERILAASLMPIGEVSLSQALAMAQEIEQVELAEVVSMKLFAKLPFASDFVENLLNQHTQMAFFIALSVAVRIETSTDEAFCRNVCQHLFETDFDMLSVTNLQYAFLEKMVIDKPDLKSMAEELVRSARFTDENKRRFVLSALEQ